jgi:hypothetical protein
MNMTMLHPRIFLSVFFVASWLIPSASHAEEPSEVPDSPNIRWTTSAPVVTPRDLPGLHVYSIKDPSIVRHADHWHLFCTIRGKERSHAIVYLNFADWPDADQAVWQVLPNHAGFCCAPQVFYFRPQGKWYLICQASDEAWTPNYQPAYAVTDDLADPATWSKLQPLGVQKGQARAWLDFWIICDEQHAYLFFTSLDGHLWRSRTPLDQFPGGWSEPVVALEGDVFEASHTYRLADTDSSAVKYLTIIEAQDGHGWRYQKLYSAERLDGEWSPLAATRDQAFASLRNVTQNGGAWTDSISHGELIRSGVDERLEVPSRQWQFLFQGVRDEDRGGKPYGEIPWRLGILKQGE